MRGFYQGNRQTRPGFQTSQVHAAGSAVWTAAVFAVIEGGKQGLVATVLLTHLPVKVPHLLHPDDPSASPIWLAALLVWFCQVRIGSLDLPLVSICVLALARVGGNWERERPGAVFPTIKVAWLGFTSFEFPSEPIIASQISSKGGFSSSYGTVNSGLSHRVMPFGSSYL